MMTHPDEGLIHAWLDGELPPDEAARIEQLVATDAAWRAAAAEARGLIAASARILSALDDVPAQVIPKATPAPRRMARWVRAAAAVVVIAGGSVVVLQRASAPMPPVAPGVPAVATAPVAAPAVEAPVASVPAALPAPTKPRQLEQPAVSSKENVRALVASNVPVASPPPVAATAQAMEVRADVAQDRAVAQSADADAKRAGALQTNQSLEQARERVTMRRTSAGAETRADVTTEVSAKAASPAPPAVLAMPEARAARAVMGGTAKASSVMPVTCFVVRDATAPSAPGSMMRSVRQNADTVFLVPTETASPLRAWIRAGGGLRPGVRYTADDAATVTAIIATPTACPTP